jgi:hypothetical protein
MSDNYKEFLSIKKQLYNKADKLSGKAKVKALKLANDFLMVYSQNNPNGVIKRRGGGIAKRGMGIAK